MVKKMAATKDDQESVRRHVRVEHGWLFPEGDDHVKLHAQMHDPKNMGRTPLGFGSPNHQHYERNGG